MRLTKEDFYCGAFLSMLLNNGIDPALFEKKEDSNRKIYDFDTNKGSFRVYVKSSETPYSESDYKSSSTWNFPLTENQIDELKNIRDNSRQLYFVFICGREKLNHSRIAVIPCNILFQCVDLDVKVRITKGSRYLEVYGSTNEPIKVKLADIYEVFGSSVNHQVI